MTAFFFYYVIVNHCVSKLVRIVFYTVQKDAEGIAMSRVGNKRGYRAVVLLKEDIWYNRRTMKRYTVLFPDEESTDLVN